MSPTTPLQPPLSPHLVLVPARSLRLATLQPVVMDSRILDEGFSTLLIDIVVRRHTLCPARLTNLGLGVVPLRRPIGIADSVMNEHATLNGVLPHRCRATPCFQWALVQPVLAYVFWLVTAVTNHRLPICLS